MAVVRMGMTPWHPQNLKISRRNPSMRPCTFCKPWIKFEPKLWNKKNCKKTAKANMACSCYISNAKRMWLFLKSSSWLPTEDRDLWDELRNRWAVPPLFEAAKGRPRKRSFVDGLCEFCAVLSTKMFSYRELCSIFFSISLANVRKI